MKIVIWLIYVGDEYYFLKLPPGINKQGSDDLYLGSSTNNIDKGHLNPSLINSYDCNHQIATFTYTNAVPQFARHNRVSWKNFEGKIANYVKHECAPKGGNMYLITGTSSYIWDRKKREKLVGAKVSELIHDKMIYDLDRRPSLLYSELWCARIKLVLASHDLPKFKLINAN